MSDINTTPLVDVMLVLLIIFLIAVPVALQTIEKLHIPVFVSTEFEGQGGEPAAHRHHDRRAGRTASRSTGYTGATRNGECRVYFNNVTPVFPQELYDQAFERLDNSFSAKADRGDHADPEMIPQVHIRGDVNTPWRCVAGTIFNVQAAGYPTVGFISNPVDPNA